MHEYVRTYIYICLYVCMSMYISMWVTCFDIHCCGGLVHNDDLSFETNITSDCSSMNQIKKDPLVEDEAKEAKSFEKESLDSCSKNGKI